MIEAIMGVGSGKSFSSVENPSSVLPLEIYSEISSFLLKLHLHHEQLLLQILNHQLVQILLLIKIKKEQKPKASRVGLSALLSQVMSVWVSTEVKTGLVTLAYDF
jgi:hypothetical protein